MSNKELIRQGRAARCHGCVTLVEQLVDALEQSEKLIKNYETRLEFTDPGGAKSIIGTMRGALT